MSVKSLLLSTSLFLCLGFSSTEYPAYASSSDFTPDNREEIESEVNNQIHSVLKFPMKKFITGAIQQIEDPKIQKYIKDRFKTETTPDRLIDLSWYTLAQLKFQQNVLIDPSSLPYLFLSMAKLYLATKELPTRIISIELPAFSLVDEAEAHRALNQYLRDRINNFNLQRQDRKSTPYKWGLIYNAMLSMDYVTRNSQDPDNKTLIFQALRQLQMATELHTTKSVYALYARLCLEYGDYLGLDAETRISVARNYIQQFKKTSEVDSGNAQAARNVLIDPSEKFWRTIARPPYFKDSLIQEEIGKLQESLNNPKMKVNETSEGEDIPQPFNIDLSTLNLSLMSDAQAETLRIHQPHDRYFVRSLGLKRYRETTYRLFDVSGYNFRCFFNSLGIEADEAIGQLRANRDNLIVRAMVANEIVAGWRNIEEFPREIRQLLNINELRERQARVDRIAASDQQHEQREFLNREQDLILEELRNRASTLEVYDAFINYHISGRINSDEDAPYRMMVAQGDVAGERADERHPILNLTSVDAIAYLNNIGIRIFILAGNALHLAHNFIPEGVQEVAYLFYDRHRTHFSTLLPIFKDTESLSESNISPSESNGNSELDKKILDKYKEAVKKGKITKKLASLLEKRIPKVVAKTSKPDSYVRLIIFLRNNGYTGPQIEKDGLIGLSTGRICTIANDNGIIKKSEYTDMHSNILDAYLSTRTLSSLKGNLRKAADLIAIHYKYKRGMVRNFLEPHITAGKYKSSDVPITEKLKEFVRSEYISGTRIHNIKTSTGLTFIEILNILDETLEESQRPHIIDPNLFISQENRDQIIVEKFDLLRKQTGKDPTIAAVSRATGYSNKMTTNTLKKAGKIIGLKTFKPLSEKTKHKVKEYWQDNGYDQQSNEEEHYRKVADHFGISFKQVQDSIIGQTPSKRMRAIGKVSNKKIIEAFHDLPKAQQNANAISLLSKNLNFSENKVRSTLHTANLVPHSKISDTQTASKRKSQNQLTIEDQHRDKRSKQSISATRPQADVQRPIFKEEPSVSLHSASNPFEPKRKTQDQQTEQYRHSEKRIKK